MCVYVYIHTPPRPTAAAQGVKALSLAAAVVKRMRRCPAGTAAAVPDVDASGMGGVGGRRRLLPMDMVRAPAAMGCELYSTPRAARCVVCVLYEYFARCLTLYHCKPHVRMSHNAR